MGNPRLVTDDPFPKALDRTVQAFDDSIDAHDLGFADSLTLYIANAASDIPAWEHNNIVLVQPSRSIGDNGEIAVVFTKEQSDVSITGADGGKGGNSI